MPTTTKTLLPLLLAVGMMLASGLPAKAADVGYSPTDARTLTDQGQPPSGSASASKLPQVLTRDVLFYLEINDVAAQVEKLRLLELLKSFAPLMDSDPKSALIDLARIEALWNLGRPYVQGTKLAVAGWSPHGANGSSDPQARPLFGFFIQFASGSGLAQLMERQQELQQAIEAFAGSPSEGKQPNVKFAILDDTLAFAETAFMEQIQAAGPSAQKLADDPDFRTARGRMLDAPLFLYADIEKLSKMAFDGGSKPAATEGESQSKHPVDNVPQILESLGLSAFHRLAIGVHFEPTQTITRALVMEKASSGETKKKSTLFSVADDRLKLAKWQHPQTSVAVAISVNWVGLYDSLMTIVNEVFGGADQQGIPPVELLDAMLGYSLRDKFLPSLGNQIGAGLRSVEVISSLLGESQPGRDSSPELTLLLGVRNREVVQGALNNIRKMASEGAPSSDEMDKVQGISMMKLGDVELGLGDDMLVLDLGQGGTRQVIEKHASGDTLATNGEYVRATQWMPQQVYTWAYVSPQAVEAVTQGMRRSAISDEPQLAEPLGLFPVTRESVTLAAWQEGYGVMTEVRLPEGILPTFMAAIAASERVEKRDRALQREIESALSKDEQFSSVGVSVKRGVVTLSGEVLTDEAKAVVQELVEKIAGVSSVINSLEVPQ